MGVRQAYIHGTAPTEQERLSGLNRLTNAPFLEFLQLLGDERVLEVGSGLGILAAEVGERLPDGEVVGVEFSGDQIAAAESNTQRNVRFVQGDAHILPFEESSFDLVYCRYVLEHVADPVQVLREMRRVLRPDGRALAQENNILINEFYPPCPAFDAIWRKFAELQSRLGGDALIGKKLFQYFKEAGFGAIELSIQPEIHWSGLATFKPWVINLIGNVESGRRSLVEHGLATDGEIDNAIREAEALMDREDSAALFYWNRASAVK